jgi:hypothetical protein
MEQSEPNKIRYTVKYANSEPFSNATLGEFKPNIPLDEPPPGSRPVVQTDGTDPAIEIVTILDPVKGCCNRATLDGADAGRTMNVRSTHMIIHSKSLSQTVREIVKFYPG